MNNNLSMRLAFTLFSLLILMNNYGQITYKPLGYIGQVKAYLATNDKSVIYDFKNEKILKENEMYLDLSYYSTYDTSIIYSGLRNKTYKFGELTDDSEKIGFGIYQLSKNKDSGLIYDDFFRNDSIYFEKNNLWHRYDTKNGLISIPDNPTFSSEIGNWKVEDDNEAEFEENIFFTTNRKDKIIKLSPQITKMVNYYGCADLLMHLEEGNVYIDTAGNQTYPDEEKLSANFDCCKWIKFDKGKLNKKCKENFGEIVSSEKIWNGMIFYTTSDNKLSYVDNNGKVFKTNFINYIAINKYKKIFCDDGTEWIDFEQKTPVSTELKSINGRYLLVKQSDGFNILDLEHTKKLLDFGVDSILTDINLDYFIYNINNSWTKKYYNSNGEFNFFADTILSFNNSLIYYKWKDEFILIDENSKILNKSKKNQIEVFDGFYKILVDRYDNGYYFSSKKNFIPFSNIENIFEINDTIALINFNENRLCDLYKREIKLIENYSRTNKEMIFTYVNDTSYQNICFDFTGKKVDCKKDQYEIINDSTLNIKNQQQMIDYIIKSNYNIYRSYPDENKAFRLYLLYSVFYKLSDNKALPSIKSDLLLLKASQNISYADIEIMIKFIDGILDKKSRKEIIKELEEKYLKMPNQNFNYFHFSENDIKSLVYFYIGYLYKLDKNKRQSKIYEDTAIKIGSEEFTTKFFKLY